MARQDPQQHAQQAVASRAARIYQAISDHLRAYASTKLIAWITAGFATVAAAAFVFPVAVAVAFAVVVTALSTWAVSAHHLLHREQRVNEWSSVTNLRARQRELRAKADVRRATLAVAGEPGRDFDARVRTYPPLSAAVNFLRGQARAARAGDLPQQRAQRQGAPPKRPDLEATRRELKNLVAEEEMVEAQIQELAAPGGDRAIDAAEKTEAFRRVRAADLEAARRTRRGLRPTAPTGELGIELKLSPDGSRSVSRRAARLTPEEIARGEDQTDAPPDQDH